MNYLFYKFTNLKIHRSIYWAKIFTAILQGVVLLPVYLIMTKVIIGCIEFSTLEENGALKWGYTLFALLLWIANYYFYNQDRIKRIDRKYRNETSVSSYLKLVFLIVLIIVWMLKAGDIIRLLVDVPDC